MILPSTRLLLLLALAAPLFLVGPWVAWTGFVVVLLLAAVDARGAGSALPAIEREAPARMSRRGTTTVRLDLDNPRERSVHVQLTDDLPDALERGTWRIETDAADADGGEAGAGRPRSAPSRTTLELDLPAAARTTVAYDLYAEGRGPAELGDLHLRTLGALGLVWKQRRIRARDPVLIQPALHQTGRNRLVGLRHRLRLAGLRNVRQRGEGHAFESLREYVRGDDPRTIEWKATARRGDLLVRQFEAERSQNVLLALDAGRLMLESMGGADRLDHAMTAALLLADVASMHGDRVGMLAFADRVQRYLPPRRQPIARLADAMAAVEPRPVESDYPLAFAHLRTTLRRRSLVVLFTDVIDPDVSAPMLAEVRRSSERHLVLTVALRNPELTARADARAPDDRSAYGRAAAEEMLQARVGALGTLRARGTLVADVEPGDAVTEVVNRYLDVKYRGLL